MQLHEWQHGLQQAILQPDIANSAFITNTALSADRIGIYADAYHLRLTEALRGNYPALHQLLGDEDFDAMSLCYLNTHPSSHASIRWHGERLADFLSTEIPYSQLPIFSELAAFEWALRHTIDAADINTFTLENIQSIAPEQWGELVFNVQPALTLLSLQWNTPQIWQALTDKQTPPSPNLHTQHWLVYRQKDLASAWRSVDSLEVLSLECIRDGNNFSDMCSTILNATQNADQTPVIAAQFLRNWITQGLLECPTKT